jgi:hypothetical protein
MASKADEFGIYRNNGGYFKREQLDLMLSGAPSIIDKKADQIRIMKR